MIEYEIPFVCLIFTTLISIVFFVKKKVKLEENKYYENILKSALIVHITNFISHYFASIYAVENINDKFALIFAVINKIGSFFIVVITINLLLYILFISFEKVKKNITKIHKIIYFIYIIIGALIFTLNFEVYKIGGVTSGKGSAVTFTFAIVLLNLIATMIIATINFKKYDKRYYSIYYIIPLIFILGLFVLYHPQFNIYDLIISLMCYLMYFTIENPDVKLLSQVEAARDKAEKANAAKTDFLSSMSHEIRTPLNAIVGFSEAIRDETNLELAKQDAKDIITASQNLLEIVNGILDISKIEANKMEIVNSEYNLQEECKNLYKLIKPRIGEKPIEFNLNLAPDIPNMLYGDRGKVKEIITNLLTNAVKYTDKGEINFSISCINKNSNSTIIISVEDTGRGIKPEKIDRLFTKFDRLEEDRNTTLEGTGLGLAITKRLVEMLNGKIIVQSVFGSGSKFIVYLPQTIAKAQKEKKIMMSTALNLTSKKVLVVDDNDLNLKIAERLLKKYNLIVETCKSGYECLEKIKEKQKYDLIFMDDMMPKMSGTETLHILKDDPEFNSKVVVLTANAIEGMKEKYIEEGFNDYLAKPIEKEELEKILRQHLNKEIENINFAPLPKELFQIDDSIIKQMNSN